MFNFIIYHNILKYVFKVKREMYSTRLSICKMGNEYNIITTYYTYSKYYITCYIKILNFLNLFVFYKT